MALRTEKYLKKTIRFVLQYYYLYLHVLFTVLCCTKRPYRTVHTSMIPDLYKDILFYFYRKIVMLHV